MKKMECCEGAKIMLVKTGSQRKIDLKYNPYDLKSYLEGYPVKFSQDLDQLWEKFDADKNNWLDQDEAKNFMASLHNCI